MKVKNIVKFIGPVASFTMSARNLSSFMMPEEICG